MRGVDRLAPAWLTVSMLAVACQRVPDAGADVGADASTGSDSTGATGDDTASTSTSTSTGTSTTDDTSSGDFVMQMDVGGAPSCDIFDPDVCPEGEKCTAYSPDGTFWDRHGCLPIMGDGQPGEPCMTFGDHATSGLDDCGKGSMCWDVDPETHVGYCIAFCHGDAANPTCDPGYGCLVGDDATLPLCGTNCDPVLAGAGCPKMEMTCAAVALGANVVPFLCMHDASGGAGEPGDECSLADAWGNECGPGLFCAQKLEVPGCASDGCCSEFCDVDAPNACAGAGQGQVCKAWVYDGMVPPGYEHVGGCGLS